MNVQTLEQVTLMVMDQIVQHWTTDIDAHDSYDIARFMEEAEHLNL